MSASDLDGSQSWEALESGNEETGGFKIYYVTWALTCISDLVFILYIVYAYYKFGKRDAPLIFKHNHAIAIFLGLCALFKILFYGRGLFYSANCKTIGCNNYILFTKQTYIFFLGLAGIFTLF